MEISRSNLKALSFALLLGFLFFILYLQFHIGCINHLQPSGMETPEPRHTACNYYQYIHKLCNAVFLRSYSHLFWFFVFHPFKLTSGCIPAWPATPYMHLPTCIARTLVQSSVLSLSKSNGICFSSIVILRSVTTSFVSSRMSLAFCVV